MNIYVKFVDIYDIEQLTKLFHEYLAFYNVNHFSCEDIERFLTDRLMKNESKIFIAKKGENIVGFVQLYPTFSSLSLKRVWILNDLFVGPGYRREGIADILMDEAEKFSKEGAAKGLSLETGVDNSKAQALYTKRGWKPSSGFLTFFLDH